MARPLRMESESGVYHVLNRGNYRTDIFRSDKAKRAFLTCLGEACEQTGGEIHAWCLMSNHYHLAVSTPKANLVEGMRWLQGMFSVRFNRLRNERGHLFPGGARRGLGVWGEVCRLHQPQAPKLTLSARPCQLVAGPSLSIRPRPEQITAWAEEAALKPAGAVFLLPPWHFGMKLRRI